MGGELTETGMGTGEDISMEEGEDEKNGGTTGTGRIGKGAIGGTNK